MKVLVAVSNLSQAKDILFFSKQFAYDGEQPVHLLLVSGCADRNFEEHKEFILAIAREFYEPLGIISIFRTGDPAKEILQVVQGGEYDLLILGDDPINYFPKLLKTSKMVAVAEQSPCPIIFVKGLPRTVRRILLCDSGAGRSSVLSRFTAQLAGILAGEEEITVLHVMSQMSAGPGVPGSMLSASYDDLVAMQAPEAEFLGKDLDELKKPGILPKSKVRHGLVLDEVLMEARKGDYDLVVIGRNLVRNWQQYLLENLTRKILIQIDRPIMVI